MTWCSIIHYSSAINERTNEKIAIKKLHRPFQSEIFAKRAYRELRLLKHMKHENVSRIKPTAHFLFNSDGPVDSASWSSLRTRWSGCSMCSRLPRDSTRCRTCEYCFLCEKSPREVIDEVSDELWLFTCGKNLLDHSAFLGSCYAFRDFRLNLIKGLYSFFIIFFTYVTEHHITHRRLHNSYFV